MKKLSKKAFTLIEILGAITILGIISIVAIVSVNKIIQRARNEHYKTAEKNFTLAAQSFVQQNRNELPKVIGQRKKVQLKTLIDNNYIEEILDYRKKECYTDQSYVQVFKYSQTDYSYIAILKCPDPQYDGNDIVTGKNNANINIDFDEDADVKDANATIKITEPNKIFSYSYTIYKNGKEVKNSGDQFVENYDTKVTKKLKLDEYAPGKIKILVTSTNIYGIPTTFTDTYKFEDKFDPKCVILDEQDENKDRDWTNQDRKITIGCDDGRGTGCTRQTYSKTFKSDTPDGTGTITIKDESGRTTKCTVIVNLDKTPPTCSVSGGNTSWTNGSRTIKASCTDTGGSKCATADFSKTYSSNLNITTAGAVDIGNGGSISDHAGNITNCAADQTVKIDTIKPTISWDTPEGPHDNSNGITVYTSCTDDFSGVESHTGNSTVSSPTTGTSKTHTCKDKAGNEVSTSRTFSVRIYSRNSICGVERYNSCPNSSCSCATYQCTLYKKCPTAGCGVASYKSCETKACGCSVYKRCAAAGCEKFSSWTWGDWSTKNCADSCPSEKNETYKKTEVKDCRNMPAIAGCGGKQYTIRTATRTCNTYKRGAECVCETYVTCANSACGENYNSCRNSACGTEIVTGSECNNASSRTCKTYNSCEDSSCGIASYNPCWHY